MKCALCLLVSMSIVICAACLAGNYTQTMSISEGIDQIGAILYEDCTIIEVTDDKGRTATMGKPIREFQDDIVVVAPQEVTISVDGSRAYKMFVQGRTRKKYWLDVTILGSKDSTVGAFTLILKQKRASITLKVNDRKLTLTPADAKLFRKEKKK